MVNDLPLICISQMLTDAHAEDTTPGLDNQSDSNGVADVEDMQKGRRKPRRRFLRFGLGTCLTLFLVVGSGVGLMSGRISRAKRIAEIVANHNGQGCNAKFDYECGLEKGVAPQPPGPEFLRKIGGDNLFAQLESIFVSNPDGYGIFEALKPEDYVEVEVVRLSNCNIGRNLNSLPVMPNLQRMSLRTNIDSLEGIERFPKLKFLRIRCFDMQIDLDPLKSCQHLECIVLGETRDIDDFSILHSLSNLEKVTINGSDLPDVEVEQLRKNLPAGCTLNFVRRKK